MAALLIVLSTRGQELAPHIALEVQIDVAAVEHKTRTVSAAFGTLIDQAAEGRITGSVAQVIAALAAGDAVLKISQNNVGNWLTCQRDRR